jgi:hypothetical protein
MENRLDNGAPSLFNVCHGHYSLTVSRACPKGYIEIDHEGTIYGAFPAFAKQLSISNFPRSFMRC